MTSSNPAVDCGRFRDMAPEIALGLVAGHERAEALAHLQECPECFTSDEPVILAAPEIRPFRGAARLRGWTTKR